MNVNMAIENRYWYIISPVEKLWRGCDKNAGVIKLRLEIENRLTKVWKKTMNYIYIFNFGFQNVCTQIYITSAHYIHVA